MVSDPPRFNLPGLADEVRQIAGDEVRQILNIGTEAEPVNETAPSFRPFKLCFRDGTDTVYEASDETIAEMCDHWRSGRGAGAYPVRLRVGNEYQDRQLCFRFSDVLYIG